MKTTNILLLGALLSAGLVACGDDTSTGTGGGGGEGTTSVTTATTGATTTATTTTGGQGGEGGEGGGGDGGSGGQGGEGGSGPPAVPELGAQLERMGRPAVNTATVDTFAYFDSPTTFAPSNTAQRNASEDAYNAAAVGSDEAAAFITSQALQLTVLDSLDGTCGNTPLYGFGEGNEACLDANGDPDLVNGPAIACYGTMATVLNFDALFVKTADYTSCGIYLGVEADGAATLDSDLLPANEDCGGRRPVDDVIANTYSLVSGALGTFPDLFLFDDGITAPADLHPAGFPYMAAPAE